MLAVTPADVAAYAPDAPPVTAAQVREALDWAEPLLERHHVTLTPDSRQERAAVRAVCCYALCLAAGGQANVTRTSKATAGGTLKTVDIDGEIKIERAVLTGDKLAAEISTAASDWLARAWLALYAAGVPRNSFIAGASR